MKFREFCKEDIIEASKLLADRHKKEREMFPTLKKEFEDSKNTEEILHEIMEDEDSHIIGICAYEDDKMLGFILSNIVIDNNMCGRCAYVDYEGLAIADTASPELYRKMYAEISKTWLEYGALIHYVTIPAGNKEVVDSWLRLSFAIEHVYGISGLSKTEVSVPDNLIIRQAEEKDAEELSKLSNTIWSQHAAAPCYCAALPEKMAGLRHGFAELPNDEDAITLLAYNDNKLVGFQSANIEDNEGNMMAPEKSFDLEIAGTIKESRGTGIGNLLTKSIFNRAMEEGYENVIADWKIANLSASTFWPKHGFKTIAYRMYRSIDERVYWADGIRVLA